MASPFFHRCVSEAGGFMGMGEFSWMFDRFEMERVRWDGLLFHGKFFSRLPENSSSIVI
jgi:hypothetical protein